MYRGFVIAWPMRLSQSPALAHSMPRLAGTSPSSYSAHLAAFLVYTFQRDEAKPEHPKAGRCNQAFHFALNARKSPAAGALFQIDLPLSGLAPGEYVVEITAGAEGGGDVKELVGFRVTA